MIQKITTGLRQVFIKALIDDEINLKDLGCNLTLVDGRPATEQEKEYWADFKCLDNKNKAFIRLSLKRQYIDLDRFIDVLV